MTRVRIPYDFEPRQYQRPLFAARDDGMTRFITVWHRRAGKDKTWVNFVAREMQRRIGNYYYYFPTLSLGRKILWQGVDKAGKPFMDHLPKELRVVTRNDEMRIELLNGSAFQIMGTDRLDVVGPNPIGCVFSEFSLQNPSAWNYIRPILAENEGWAGFNFTPRGYNHAYRLHQMAKDSPEIWFESLLTVDDTGAIPKEAIELERKSGMSDELIQQEFYCSYDYGLEGAYYLKQLARAREEGRIASLPWNSLPVYTAWDIGTGDSTAIIFFQLSDFNVIIVDAYSNHGEGVEHYAQVLQQKAYERGFVYAKHFGPHDLEQAEWGAGQTKRKSAMDFGIDFEVLEKTPIDDGIEAVRTIFPRCWFDNSQIGVTKLLDALNNYQKEYDEKHEVFRERPLHNWASDFADAMRYLALAVTGMQLGNTITRDEARRLFEQYAPPVVM